ncbi:MAG TPA: LpxD N-terminal domain-containing protein, partial [Thermoanaerobaculia bacterium]|nr:LpxD N-terminal domain-containing protein [Thermoanaerobaculia bacterium]
MARSRVPTRGAGRPRRSRGASAGFRLDDVAAAVGGRIHGDAATRLNGVAPLESAGPRDLSWVADERRSREAASSRAGALLSSSAVLAAGKPCVVVASPPLALAIWLESLHPAPAGRAGVARGAHVRPGARIAPSASVEAGATVEAGARIGARTRLRAGAFVGERAEIGEDCVLGPGSA